MDNNINKFLEQYVENVKIIIKSSVFTQSWLHSLTYISPYFEKSAKFT